METLKKVGRWLAPAAKKSEDGRDQWGSRLSFILAAMGGAVGLGNLLRYPGQVFNNNGVQWFIPYLIALTCIGIPVLMLEICIGQAYRGGCLIAFDHISKRTKGVGLAVVFNGYVVITYYVPILAWVMTFFRNSFTSPMPWTGRGEEYFMGTVIANGERVVPDSGMISYPESGMVPETVAWCLFTWFVIWLCIFRGVGLTGRVVYFTMGLPIVMAFILIGRGASLPNASRGIKLYWEWNGEQLGRGDIWQAACGQIFFSIGIGMGYFTSFASYNQKHANAVQDAFIIAISNSMYEVFVAFAVFGVVGFLDLKPSEMTLGTFSIGFLTYPEALAAMPGANFWAICFFFTLFLLGMSSAFALLETVVTMICDTDWGKKFPRPVVVTIMTVISFLISLMFCSKFGYYLLDAVDTYVNNLCLFFVVWWEVASATTIYRHKDVRGQVGKNSYLIFNGCYFLAHVLGISVGQGVGPAAGAGLGFGIFIVGTLTALFLAKTPDSPAPRFWGNNTWLTKLWWIMFYQGVQLQRDLNVTIATGNNWPLPVFWAALLKYISCPILAIIYSFVYRTFQANDNDPLHVYAFTVGHLVMVIITFGFVVPRWFDVFIPVERRGEGWLVEAPNVTVVGHRGFEEVGVREVEGGADVVGEEGVRQRKVGVVDGEDSASDGVVGEGLEEKRVGGVGQAREVDVSGSEEEKRRL